MEAACRAARPVEIAHGVWWVGVRLPNDSFQCHAYYLENGDEGVLVDPGSPLTIDATLAKVEQITSLTSIKYLVCHHPDPDIAASLPHLSEAARSATTSRSSPSGVPRRCSSTTDTGSGTTASRSTTGRCRWPATGGWSSS